MSSHYLCTNPDGQPEIPTPEMFNLLLRSDKIKDVPDRIKELVGEEKDLNERKLIAIQRAYNTPEKTKTLELVKALNFYNEAMRIGHTEFLERFKQLRLPNVDRLTITNKSYEEYEPKDGDIIYCDPPYENTDQYQAEAFNYKAFYKWAADLNRPVFVSSYDINHPGLTCIYAKTKRELLSNHARTIKWERLYANAEGLRLYNDV